VLVETWQKGDLRQLHLVNYAAEAQDVRVEFMGPVAGRVLTPDDLTQSLEPGPEMSFQGAEVELTLGVYAVLEHQT
jgi:hypothetical protein